MSQGLFGVFHTKVMLQRRHLYLLLFQPCSLISTPITFSISLLAQVGHLALSFTRLCNCSRSASTVCLFLAWACSCSVSLSQVSSICRYSSSSLFSIMRISARFLK